MKIHSVGPAFCLIAACGASSPPPATSSAPLELSFVERIDAPPNEVWSALTSPDMTRQFFHGTAVDSDLAVGEPFVHRSGDGTQVVIDGVVRESDPPNRLSYTFRFPEYEDEPTVATYALVDVGDGTTQLTITHDGFEAETRTYRRVVEGWPPVLEGLKALFEERE